MSATAKISSKVLPVLLRYKTIASILVPEVCNINRCVITPLGKFVAQLIKLGHYSDNPEFELNSSILTVNL